MNQKLSLLVFILLFSITKLTALSQDTVRLNGEILDSSTGAAIPARLYIESADGKPFLAHSVGGRAIPYEKVRQKSVEVHTSLSAHPFEADLPPGTYTLTVERGKEYIPAKQTVTLTDSPVKVEIRLQRWIDMNKRGWFSGETHVHRPLMDLITLILCEELNVALPLTAWVSRAEDTPLKNNRNEDPVPSAELIKVDDTHVIWPINTEYEIGSVNKKRHTLGALFILNHKKQLDLSAPPVGPIAVEARKQGALLDLDKQNWPWSMMLMPAAHVDLFELTNNHIWRTNFAFSTFFPEYIPDYMNIERNEMGFTERGWIDFGFKNYYALLNCGFDMKPSAGTASGVHPVPLGFGRVYVKLDGAFSYEKWIDGLRDGHSFVTTGPMLEVEFNNNGPGGRFQLGEADQGKVVVEGEAKSIDPLSSIEIIVNGRVAQTIPAKNESSDDGVFSSHFKVAVPVESSSWIAVRTFTKPKGGSQRFAHTAPIHVDVPNQPLRPRRVEVEYLTKRIRDEITRHEGVLGKEAMKEFREAEIFYQSLLKDAQ